MALCYGVTFGVSLLLFKVMETQSARWSNGSWYCRRQQHLKKFMFLMVRSFIVHGLVTWSYSQDLIAKKMAHMNCLHRALSNEERESCYNMQSIEAAIATWGMLGHWGWIILLTWHYRRNASLLSWSSIGSAQSASLKV